VIADHDGRIDRYLGDAVVVTWPHSGGPADRRCLDCFFAVDDLLAARAEAYRQRFGLTPRYRAGIHGGHVVTGEIGRQRKEILFLGDTVNTAARIEEAAKAMGRRLLVTGAVLDGLAPDGTFCAEALGPFTPRGRQGAVPLYAVERAPT
jgi:class 3 adenylate cyclase